MYCGQSSFRNPFLKFIVHNSALESKGLTIIRHRDRNKVLVFNNNQKFYFLRQSEIKKILKSKSIILLISKIEEKPVPFCFSCELIITCRLFCYKF